jgi:serralysin
MTAFQADDILHRDGPHRVRALTGDTTNLLLGTDGNDNLRGGKGADVLVGGLGSDTLIGGLGADVFVFADPLDSVAGDGRDVIQDFKPSLDRMDLSGLDADLSTPDINEALRYTGETAASNAVWWQGSGRGVLVQADLDGDARADVEVFIKGYWNLTEGDFIL